MVDIFIAVLLLETDSLSPGMEAAAPVRRPGAPELDLVGPGVVLDAEMIGSLRAQGVAALWVRWPRLECLDGRVNHHVGRLRHDVCQRLAADFEQGPTVAVGIARYAHYCELINTLLIALVADRQNGLGIHPALLREGLPDPANHAANVACLALALSLRMEGYVIQERQRAGALAADNLTNLGVGAMLHDIGKLQLPSTLLDHEPTMARTSQAYREHPRRGCRMINERVGATARCVVMHHHQRFDGTGFPDLSSVTRQRRSGPLAGTDIHIFPRIVAVVDAFDNLCRDAKGRPRPPAAALHDMRGPALRGRFDPVILRGLLRHVPPFGLGTRVTLSDGRLGAVIGLNAARPCRPLVRLLGARRDRHADVDLAMHEDLRVAQAMGVKVEQWYYELPGEVKVAVE